MAQVFISYAREDQVLAISLRNDLFKRGITCWLDAYDIKAGNQWEQLMIQQLEQAQHVVFLHSQFSATKGGAIAKEYDAALKAAQERGPESSYLIFLKLDNSLPRTIEAQEYHWLDLSINYHQCVADIHALCNASQNSHSGVALDQDARYLRIIGALCARDYPAARAMCAVNTGRLNNDGPQHLLHALALIADSPLRSLGYKQALEIHHQLYLSYTKGGSIALTARLLLALKLDYFKANHVNDPEPSVDEVYSTAQSYTLNGIELELYKRTNISEKARAKIQ